MESVANAILRRRLACGPVSGLQGCRHGVARQGSELEASKDVLRAGRRRQSWGATESRPPRREPTHAGKGETVRVTERCAAARRCGLRVRAHRVRGDTDGTANPIRSKAK